MNLVTAHLTRLTTFAGRENRQPFWLWVLVNYGVQMLLSFVLTIPLTIGMTSRMQALQRYDQAYLDAHPEIATRLMMDTMVPFFRYFMLLIGAIVLIHMVLMAAAVARRLHDTNRSGYWALPVVVTQTITLAGYALILPRLFGGISSLGPQPAPDAVNAIFASIMPLFALTWLSGLLGFVFMIVLIVFLAQRGTVGPNRYGDDLLPPPVIPPWQAQPQWQQPQWQQPQWQPPAPPPPPPPARIVGPWDQPRLPG